MLIFNYFIMKLTVILLVEGSCRILILIRYLLKCRSAAGLGWAGLVAQSADAAGKRGAGSGRGAASSGPRPHGPPHAATAALSERITDGGEPHVLPQQGQSRVVYVHLWSTEATTTTTVFTFPSFSDPRVYKGVWRHCVQRLLLAGWGTGMAQCSLLIHNSQKSPESRKLPAGLWSQLQE